MRRDTLRVVPVCVVVFACGCFLTQPFVGTGAAAPTPTHTYWRQVNAILAQKPTSNELPVLVELVRKQTDQLRELPTEGVDADLLTAVENVIKAEDAVLYRASMVDSDPERLKTSEGLAKAFADANRAAAESKKRLRALQPTLNTRHGGGF
jgi:hypothetical protein